MYFFTNIGSSFFNDSFTALAFGLVIVLITALVIVQGCSGGVLRRNRIWFSFVLFGFLSSIVNTVGRAGFGLPQALASRYAPVAIIGIVGLYLLAVSVSEELPAKSKSFGAHALLALMLVGLLFSYGSYGWQAGQNWRSDREMSAYILRTYKIQSDENIMRYLHPVPAVVREGGKFLEQYKLNVFSEPSIDISTLTSTNSSTLSSIDTVNGKIVYQQPSPIVIHLGQQQTLTIGGWAVDKQTNNVASAVFITIDGKIDIPTLYGLSREDIANGSKNPNLRFCGYIATFSSSILNEGEHTISLKVVSKNEVYVYYAEQVVHLVVK